VCGYDEALSCLDMLANRPGMSQLQEARIVARRTAIYALTRTPQEG